MKVISQHLKTARLFANLMDDTFKFLGVGFGFDTILGSIPGVGDVVTILLSLYLIWIGFQMKLPSHRVSEMVKNVMIDAILGSVPVLGDIVDVFYKANLKNVRILEAYAAKNHAVTEGEVVT